MEHAVEGSVVGRPVDHKAFIAEVADQHLVVAGNRVAAEGDWRRHSKFGCCELAVGFGFDRLRCDLTRPHRVVDPLHPVDEGAHRPVVVIGEHPKRQRHEKDRQRYSDGDQTASDGSRPAPQPFHLSRPCERVRGPRVL